MRSGKPACPYRRQSSRVAPTLCLPRELAMQPLSPAPAEEVLTQLTHHFAQWRQSRPTPRSRIPAGLWARALALTATFSVTRVAKQLGLTPYALKRHRKALQETPAQTALPQPPQFVEVAPAWRTLATEVE